MLTSVLITFAVLAAGAQAALMPRQSAPAPKCYLCPFNVNGPNGLPTVDASGDVTCPYTDADGNPFNCVYSEAKGKSTTPDDLRCAPTAISTRRLCKPVWGKATLVNYEDSNGELECDYGTKGTCYYNETSGALDDALSTANCPAAINCAKSAADWGLATRSLTTRERKERDAKEVVRALQARQAQTPSRAPSYLQKRSL